MRRVNSKSGILQNTVYLLLAGAVALLSGCGDPTKSLWQQIKDLSSEKTSLEIQVEKLQQENAQFSRQIRVLENMDPNDRLAAVDVLAKAVIGSRSGLYDKDNDGKKEMLVVYIETTDVTGDCVKAPGRVNVKLWDLNSENTRQALLKQWTVDPEILRTCWVATAMTHYYRLQFPVDRFVRGDETGLTVKIQFTDYFSGKILEDQKPIR